MSIFTNPGKVLDHLWDNIKSVFNSGIAPFLKHLEKQIEDKGEQILLEVGKAVLEQAKAQLGQGAKAGDIIKAAVDLGLPLLKKKGIEQATILFYGTVASLLLAIESQG